MITTPIRVTDTFATIIDHIITNDTKHPILPGILYSDISDHYPIFCQTDNNFCFLSGKSTTECFLKDKSNSKSDSFCHDLEHNLYNFGDQFPILNIENLDKAFNEFTAVIYKTIDTQAPLKRLSRKQRKQK